MCKSLHFVMDKVTLHPTVDSAAWLLKLKLRPDIDIDVSHRTTNSSPVENCHAAFHCSGGSFGVAVPTTFSVLDGNKQRSLKFQVETDD